MQKSAILPILLVSMLAATAFAAPPSMRAVQRKPIQGTPLDGPFGEWAAPAAPVMAQEPGFGAGAAMPSPNPSPTPVPEQESPEEMEETEETPEEISKAEALKPYRRNPFWPVNYATTKKEAHEAAVAAQNDPTRLAEIEEEEKRRASGILVIPDEEWEEMEQQLPQVKGIMPSLFQDPRPAVSFRGEEYWNRYFHEGDTFCITNRGVVYNWTITNISYAVGNTGCHFGRTTAVSETISKP